jgi:hypothetical protein
MPGLAGGALDMNCPHCRLSIELDPRWLIVRHCARCMGRNRALVEPFRSSPPAHLLYADGSLPSPDAPPKSLSAPGTTLRGFGEAMTLGLVGHRGATEAGDALKAVRSNPTGAVRGGPGSQTAAARQAIDDEMGFPRPGA